jgi:hypothetical protein
LGQFKYFLSGSPTFHSSPNNVFIDGFQALLTDQFYNSSTSFTIQEETIFGSKIFNNVDVRVTRAIDSITGQKRGDDYKTILFSDLDHATGLGYLYYFDSNYWVVVFSEIIKNLAASAMVRRCNNVLRWAGDDGTIYNEYCVLEYTISRPRDEMGTVNPVLPAGYVNCFAQLNDRTQLIKGNQRFIFGTPNNRIAMKVFGDGVISFLNQKTLDDESGQLLELTMGGNFVNHEVDDLVNGIADRYLDYNTFTSASTVGSLTIVSNPPTNQIFESASAIYTVNYYRGSNPISGSFIFTISGSNVPADHYTFSSLSANSFSVINKERWLDDTLNVIASGSSGSRVLNLELRGKW